MESILEELNQIPGVLGSLIVGTDGLVIVHAWDQEVDMDMLGADSADVFNAANSLMNEKLENGEVSLLSIETDQAKFFVRGIDESTLLAVIASPDLNLGLLRIEISAAAEKLKEVL